MPARKAVSLTADELAYLRGLVMLAIDEDDETIADGGDADTIEFATGRRAVLERTLGKLTVAQRRLEGL